MADELSSAELAQARRVAEAKATVPHLYFEAEAEAEGVATEHLVVAAASALRDHPRLNGCYRDARFELHPQVNVGVAVAIEAGFVFPVINDADTKPADAIAEELDRLSERARAATITQPELSGGTFSLADLAPLGISRASLVVNRGQAAILAVGARAPSLVTLSLACDGRIVRAADAAGFLTSLADSLPALA